MLVDAESITYSKALGGMINVRDGETDARGVFTSAANLPRKASVENWTTLSPTSRRPSLQRDVYLMLCATLVSYACHTADI